MESPYKYHSKEEYISGTLKFNPECPACLKIKGERIYRAVNPTSPEAV